MLWTRQRLVALLDALDIPFRVVEHAPVHTVEEGETVRRLLKDGIACKCLLLKHPAPRENHSEGRVRPGFAYYLIGMKPESRVNVKTLAARLQCPRLSFANPEELWEVIRAEPGSVSLLSAFNDTAGLVTVIIAQDVLENTGLLYVHPFEETASLGLSGADLFRVLTQAGHTPMPMILD